MPPSPPSPASAAAPASRHPRSHRLAPGPLAATRPPAGLVVGGLVLAVAAGLPARSAGAGPGRLRRV